MSPTRDGNTFVTGTGSPSLPRLTIIRGKNKGREFFIKNDDTSIGRSPECDILIDDNNISRKHARIVFITGIFFVYDNESMNGTFVNGKKMVEAQIKSGDTIKIGDCELKFEYEKEGHKAPDPRKVKTYPSPSKIDTPPLDMPFQKKGKSSRGRLYLWAIVIIGGIFAFMLIKKQSQKALVKNTAPAPQAIITPYQFKVEATPLEIPQDIKESDPTALYSQGLIAMMAENYKEAISLFKKTLAIDPDHQSAKINLEKSIKLLKQSIEELYASGVREYDILYFDRAILQWKKVLTLARGFDRPMYKKARERIAEANKRLKGK